MSQAQRAEPSIAPVSTRSRKESEAKTELSEENDTPVRTAAESKAAMQTYRDMTVYPETDDEADGNRREVYRGSLDASDHKVNGVGGLHSGLQARAQVICGGATDAVARQGILLPSLIAVPAGYFFVAVSVHYLPTGVYLLAAANSKAESPLARLSVTPARRPAG
ncbi:unnamed protein product, partial [Symbiodinium sp. KB8]